MLNGKRGTSVDWNGVFNDIIANIIFSIGSFLIIILGSYFIILKIRANRLRFLRISKNEELAVLPIYIAHLVIIRGGALLADGTPSRHFEGSAVPLREVEAAQKIEKMLKSGMLEIIPQKALTSFATFYRGFVPLTVNINPAPLEIDKLKHLPRLIVIGGPEFNSATAYFMKKANMFRILAPAECDQPTISIRNREGKEELITPDSPDYNLGIVQRCSFENGSQVILLLTGIGTNGTLASVDWFLKNWDKLNKKTRMQDFGLCLQCPKRIVDPYGYRFWTLRREYPEGILTGSISR